MKIKHLVLFLSVLIFVCACKKNTTGPNGQEEPADPKAKVEPLNVDNTKPISTDNRVIYELNLFNFTSAGTLSAAEARLPELNKLGIDIVWLMPIQTRSTQGKIGSLGSPYALRNYTEVNPKHGTMADFQSFVSKAHELGMEIWLDWVPNHTGLDNVWVTEHPEYYETKNGEIVHPNNYGDVYQLNYGNADLQKAMIDAMIYWIKNADIDGFRCDYVSSPKIPASFWQKAIPEIRAAGGSKYIWMLGEADFAADAKALLSVGFDYDYAWGYHDRIKNLLGTNSSAIGVKNQSKSLIVNGNYANMDRMVYLTNHDDIGDNFSANYFNYWNTNVPPLTVVEFTLYGMPLLYNGQEIGYRKVQNYFNKDVINWSNPNKQIQNTIRTLIALRHTQKALASGQKKEERPKTTFLETDNSSVLAYTKKQDDNEVLVVVSFANSATQVQISGITAGTYELWLNKESIAKETTKETCELEETKTLTLPQKGYLVYVKK